MKVGQDPYPVLSLPDVNAVNDEQALTSKYTAPSVHVRNVNKMISWLAFPCFGCSEILNRREASAINDLQFSRVRGRLLGITIGKIFNSIISMALLVPATVVNLVAAAIFKLIACGSKFSEDKLALNNAAKETLNLTREYWVDGFPLLLGRIFSNQPMIFNSQIETKINANLNKLNLI